MSPLSSHYLDGDTLRSRSIGTRVLHGTLDIPAPPPHVVADWARDIATQLDLAPGDVEVMPLARTRARWPELKQCIRAMAAWMDTLGLPGVLDAGDIALMVCRGARYHHDGNQYGGSVFCNLFLSDDKAQDVHFPGANVRIPLRRGTALLFDTCQPHSVIRRGHHGFHAEDFAADADQTQLFLTWELPVDDARVAQALGIAVDVESMPAGEQDVGQVLWHGAAAEVCPDTGAWQRPADPLS